MDKGEAKEAVYGLACRLGKTLTTISLIIHGVMERRSLIEEGKLASHNMTGPTLIVSPLSVLQTWCEQIQEHTDGSLRVYVYHGGGRTKNPAVLMLYDVVLTTYSVLSSEFIPEVRFFLSRPLLTLLLTLLLIPLLSCFPCCSPYFLLPWSPPGPSLSLTLARGSDGSYRRRGAQRKQRLFSTASSGRGSFLTRHT